MSGQTHIGINSGKATGTKKRNKKVRQRVAILGL